MYYNLPPAVIVSFPFLSSSRKKLRMGERKRKDSTKMGDLNSSISLDILISFHVQNTLSHTKISVLPSSCDLWHIHLWTDLHCKKYGSKRTFNNLNQTNSISSFLKERNSYLNLNPLFWKMKVFFNYTRNSKLTFVCWFW